MRMKNYGQPINKSKVQRQKGKGFVIDYLLFTIDYFRKNRTKYGRILIS